jgi:hypothetical protein
MLRPIAIGAASLLVTPAFGHGVAGDYLFVSTLIVDDPFVADEASLPTFSYLPQPKEAGATPELFGLGFEWDKTITDRLGIGLGGGYQWLRQPGMKTANGWQNLDLTLKYQLYVNNEHAFAVSAGVIRECARTGASGANGALLGNDDTSSTTPTLYFGKGFSEMPVGWLRPFAITGTIGYQIADKKLKVAGTDPDTGEPVFNNGISNRWTGGLTLQYSLRYLQTQVKDIGLPTFANRLTPLVEVAWSSPASKPSDTPTQYLFGIGLIYTANGYAIGIEALIPGNRQTGSHAGVIAQLHFYFDDLFPRSLGRPVAQWW